MTEAVPLATMLVNENARGVARGFDAPRAAEHIRRHGFDVRVVYPETAEAATNRAREIAARGDQLLFVAGGDGTLRDVALGTAGTETALAPIPLGTVNVLAREMGIPREPFEAIDAHLAGRKAWIDIGRARPNGGQPADSRCFLLMASAGWDAEIARSVNPRLKKRVGDAAYMLRAATALPGLRPVQARWRTGAEQHEGPLALIVIHNTRLYGGLIRFAPDAIADDGLLDVVALCPHSLLDGARLARKAATGSLHGDPMVRESRASEVAIETPGIPVQLDGDFAGETPMRFTVERRALKVSLPPGPLPAILAAH